ncbi:MAG: diguanylate cyclase [Gammaproteobacteria bacterium]|nr:diguanylate cyclase [Gammaproteobacteria bacterium]
MNMSPRDDTASLIHTGVTGQRPRVAHVRLRLTIFLAIMLGLLTITGGFTYTALNRALADFEQVTNIELLQMRRMVFLQDAISNASFPIHSYIAHGDPLEREVFKDGVDDVENSLQEAKESPYLNAEQKTFITLASNEWAQARVLGEGILNTPFPLPPQILARNVSLFENHIEGAKDVIYHVHNLTLAHIDALRASIRENHRQTQIIIISAYTTGLITFIAAFYAIFRLILRPLNILKEGARHYTEGNLSYQIPINTPDEFGELAEAFNKMARTLGQDQQRLAEMASRDGLTGLYNRHSFEQMLMDEMVRFHRHNHPLSLMILDLDHFKNVNDNYGHMTGDNALKLVSRIIGKICRTGDVIARFGGEEIVILMPETPAENATILAERIRTAIASTPVKLGNGEQITITTSVGVASIPDDATTPESLIIAADFALYEAKRSGRNCVRRASEVRQIKA